jgi:hypothetical protein
MKRDDVKDRDEESTSRAKDGDRYDVRIDFVEQGIME